MAQARVLILRTAGTNCDEETVHAFELVGARAERVHVNRLIEEPALLGEYQILALAGGFSYGDDLGAGRILANQLAHHFREEVGEFVSSGRLVLGICNGFQVLVKAGLLPAVNHDTVAATGQATITYNDSGKFEDRWIHLEPSTNKCVFIEPGKRLYLPIAHGEGKVCFASPELMEQMQAAGQVAFRYVDADGNFGGYPVNPNGSTDHIAALCDPTGRVLGMMPHPERFVHRTHHPHWTRTQVDEPDGLGIFRQAVGYFG